MPQLIISYSICCHKTKAQECDATGDAMKTSDGLTKKF